MFRLLAGTVCKPDDREAGYAAIEVGLDLDSTGVEADERMRDSAREHPTQARLPGRRCLCRESAKRQYSSPPSSGA